MKNFYVTYTFPSADSRDGFLQEVRLLADITRKEQGSSDMTIFTRWIRKTRCFCGNSGNQPRTRKNIQSSPILP